MIYATIESGVITLVTAQVEGQSNFRTLEELQAALDPGSVLAGAPVVCREYQQDSGSCAVVQIDLPVEDG